MLAGVRLACLGADHASPGHHVVMVERIEYVLDTDGMGAGARVAACRGVLSATSADIASFQCDIPFCEADAWPPDVRRAAQVLSSLKKPSHGEDELYRLSGVVPKTDHRCWDAFICFAPYAFDASACDDQGHPIVSLADCASSIAVWLTREQASVLAASLGPHVLVAYQQWRKSRPRRRRW
jgi:hypothetical protein